MLKYDLFHDIINEKDCKKLKSQVTACNVNETDDMNRSILMYAFLHKRSENLIRFLIETGAYTHVRDNLGVNVLMYALEYKASDELIQLIINRGAIINTSDFFKRTVLMYAIQYNASSITIKHLIEKSNITSCDINGRCAYIYAMEYGVPIGIMPLLML